MNNFNHIFLFSLLILISIGVYFIFKPFLVAIFLAFILSQLFESWHHKILQKFKIPSLSAFLTSLLIFLIIFLPLSLTAKLAVSELKNIYQNINSDNFQQTSFLLTNQTLNSVNQYFINNNIELNKEIKNIDINDLTTKLGNAVITITKYFYRSLSQFLFTLFIMFFCLYYFFKDNDRLIKKIINLSPLKNSQERKLLANFINISRATLKGSLVIAIIQGVLTTILFIITGIPSAVLLGVIATIFALIPMIGTSIVWLPVAVITLILGNFWQGITILLVGSLFIGTIDNFLRPQLIGNSTSLHPLLVFLSTIGGISFFGITGFLLGPVTVVLFLNLLDIYKTEFAKKLKKYNQG